MTPPGRLDAADHNRRGAEQEITERQPSYQHVADVLVSSQQ